MPYGFRVVPSAGAREEIYDAVGQIPPGKVATYGQIAALVGLFRCARMVGHALHVLPDGRDVPWHRVVNARGTISAKGREEGARIQRVLLEAEGVTFDNAGRIDLRRFRWSPLAQGSFSAGDEPFNPSTAR